MSQVNTHVAEKPDNRKKFVVVPKRRIVERAFARMGRHRRLSKDCELTTAGSEAMIGIAKINLMLNRRSKDEVSAETGAPRPPRMPSCIDFPPPSRSPPPY